MATKFGFNQINNPTPSKINLIVRVATVVLSAFLAYMPSSPIGSNTQHIMSGIIGLILGIINGLAPLFGIQVMSETIPTEKVTAADTESKN